jgi:SAM-dependent methyltransferase
MLIGGDAVWVAPSYTPAGAAPEKTMSGFIETNEIKDTVRAFYDLHPYPPPVDNLDGYHTRWQDNNRQRVDFHLHWPRRPYRENLRVLVAGCGTSQAAKHALRRPAAHVVGIDLSETSIRHTLALKRKYNLTNLEVHHLPIERVGELGTCFDMVVCTGVLHHLSDPEAGLHALSEVLEPDGVMNLMVYATYGRAGIYMLQEYCHRLGIGNSSAEVRELAQTLMALPNNHPLARLLGEVPDFQTPNGLADALCHPQDRAYTVPQLFELLEKCGMTFSRWIRQAPYLPQCSGLNATPHAARLTKLPIQEQFAAVELFRGTMLRHSLIAHSSKQLEDRALSFHGDEWQSFIPLRLTETVVSQKRLLPGVAAILINPGHTDTELALPIDAEELKLFNAIDGQCTIADIIDLTSSTSGSNANLVHIRARRFFEQLWWYDQVVFAAFSGNRTEP